MAEEQKKQYNNLSEHFQEPLFAVSVAVFVITLAKLVAPQTVLTFILILLGLASVYFVYMYFKNGVKNYWFMGVPALILITALFSRFADTYDGIIAQDYKILTVAFGSFLLAYVASMHKIVKPSVAIVLALFFSSLFMRMVPAEAPYIDNLDSYWYYRWAIDITTEGHVMDHDYLTYPPEGYDIWHTRLLSSVFMGSMAVLLKPFGIGVFETAMLDSGLAGVFTVVLFYLLVRELFSDQKPYAHVAAALGAFALMSSPAFASQAVATNPEDDALGMFMFVAAYFLLAASLKRRSLGYAVMSGFALLLLNLTWGGYEYAAVVIGIFGVAYAAVNFIQKKNCVEHIPYILLPILISMLSPLVLHKHGALPVFQMPSQNILIAIGGALTLSFVLEMIRSKRYGLQLVIDSNTISDRLENLVQKNLYVIGALILLAAIVFVVTYITPGEIFDTVISRITHARADDIIGLTTAEQATMCLNDDGSINIDACVNTGYRIFGLTYLFGLGMVPILFYWAVKKRSLGATFVLSWSLPILWGVFHRSQMQFISSVPVAALGATIGLLSAMKKTDLEGGRVVVVILLLFVPVLYIPFFGVTPIGDINYGDYIFTTPMHRGPMAERYYWDSAFQWLKTQSFNGSILTWWDYGHWLTAETGHISILDNLKIRDYMVQEIAKFHVMITNESEALAIARKYDADYVIIDYTMIGKAAAPYFISRGDFSNKSEEYIQWLQSPTNPNRKGYGQCGFISPGRALFGQSEYQTIVKPQLISEGGKVSYMVRVVFGCNAYIAGIMFEIRDDRITDISVVDPHGTKIPWSTWVKDHDASILGIQPLIGNETNPGMLMLAVSRPDDNLLPTYRTLVYVPDEFHDFMETRIYLSDYIDEYKALGLYTHEVNKLKHFKLVGDFTGGYVRVYEIIYQEEMPEQTENETTVQTVPENETTADCLERYNTSENTVMFYHTTSCPHCQNMMPLVEELQGQGYKFLWINANDAENRKVADECLSGVLKLGGGVPQFACPATGALQLGEFPSIDAMKEFATNCSIA